MTRSEFLAGWDKLLLNFSLPRQVWQYQGVPPAGLMTPDRFTELYFNEVKSIGADEFMAVIEEYIAHSGSKSFPLVPDIKRIHVEMFWFRHMQEREQQERERMAEEDQQQRVRFKQVAAEVMEWPQAQYDRFVQRVGEIKKEFGMFLDYKGLADGAHRYAYVKAYEEMTHD